MSKPEKHLRLFFREDAILQNRVFIRLNQVSAMFLQRHREYQERYPADDVRPWTYQKIAQVLAYYRLSLCYSFGILTRVDNMGRILEPGIPLDIKPERAETILKEYEQYLTFSFFHVLFSSLESSMRSIAATVPVPKRNGKYCRETDKFSDIYAGLIQLADADEQYRSLFDLLLLVRNCIHNRSIYLSDKGSRCVEYRGVKYEFVQGRPIEFATIDFLFNLLVDVKSFFDILYETENFKAQPFIRDHVL